MGAGYLSRRHRDFKSLVDRMMTTFYTHVLGYTIKCHTYAWNDTKYKTSWSGRQKTVNLLEATLQLELQDRRQKKGHEYNLIHFCHFWKSAIYSSMCHSIICNTVETLYSTIYYSKYFIELNIDKSTQYVALWTHKTHPIPRPFGRAMECLLWVFQQKLIVL